MTWHWFTLQVSFDHGGYQSCFPLQLHFGHSGTYKTWTDVLAFFGGNVEKATELVIRRRGEKKGTSQNRNDGQETFLLFDDEERRLTTTSIEPCLPYYCSRFEYPLPFPLCEGLYSEPHCKSDMPVGICGSVFDNQGTRFVTPLS